MPTADIKLSIPGAGPDGGVGALSPAYTCEGKNASPRLTWRNIPDGTAELAIFALNLLPVDGNLHFDWAVAGLSPSLEGLNPGELPAGTVVGRNGDGKIGYSICPQDGSESYVFALYALPKSVSPKTGFDPLALRKQATRLSDSVGLYTVSYGVE